MSTTGDSESENKENKITVGTEFESTAINASGGPFTSTTISGMVPITGATITTSPAVGSTWVGGGMVTSSPVSKPKPSKVVDAPNRRPKKILVAFLDDKDEIEWCAKVHPDDIDLTMGMSDPATRMTLGFWLIEAD